MSRDLIGLITCVESGPGKRKTLHILSDGDGDSTVVLTRPNSDFNYGCSNKEYRNAPHVFPIRSTPNGRHLELCGAPMPATPLMLEMMRPAVLKNAFELLRRNGLTWRDLAAYSHVRTGLEGDAEESAGAVVSDAKASACDVAGRVGNYFDQAVRDRRNDR